MDPSTQQGFASSSPSLVDASKCLRGITSTIVGVLFGPLRLQPETDETAKNLFRLLNIFGILDTDIEKISVHPKSDYVRIDFKSTEMADFIVMAVKERSAVKRVFNFTRLSDTPGKLQAVKITEAPKELRDKTKMFADSGPAGPSSTAHHLVTYSPVDEDVLCVVKSSRKVNQEAAPGTMSSEKVFELMPLSLGVDTIDITLPLDMPEIVMDTAQPSVCNNPAKKDEAMTTLKLPHPFWQGPPFYLFHGRVQLMSDFNFFHEDIKINEDDPDKSISDIAYTVCVKVTYLANRRGGGSLFMGVTDDGLAEGFEIPAAAVDKLKLEIDNTMSANIRPMLLPYSYKVNYVKVIGNKGKKEHFCTVLEVHVEGKGNRDVTYTYANSLCVYDDRQKKILLQASTDRKDRRRW